MHGGDCDAAIDKSAAAVAHSICPLHTNSGYAWVGRRRGFVEQGLESVRVPRVECNHVRDRVEFDTFAGSLLRLSSLHTTAVPGFHQMTPRATPTIAVFPKS